MKSSILFLILLFSFSSFGQSIQMSATAQEKMAELLLAEAKINQITSSAGIAFKEGLLNLEKDRSRAAEKFDRAVEVFLLSGVSIYSSAVLQNCYNQLIETVYRIEVPSNLPPPIKSLAVTCRWNIEPQLIDQVLAQWSASISKTNANNKPKDKESITSQTGFRTQEFEPSSQDELSKNNIREPESTKTLPQKTFDSPVSNDAKSPQSETPRRKCEMTLKDAPVLRSLKLGMSVKEVAGILQTSINLLPAKTGFYLMDGTASALDRKMIDVGEKSFSYKVPEWNSDANLAGVRNIELGFYNDSLFSIEIFYRSTDYKWKNAQEFVDNVSEKLNIQNNLWEVEDSYGMLFCKEFTIFAWTDKVDIYGATSLNLEDSIISRELKSKAKRAYQDNEHQKLTDEESKKKAFKP